MTVILLAGSDFYPAGWDDFRGVFETSTQAVEALRTIDAHWAQIIDHASLRLLENWKCELTQAKCLRCKGTGELTLHASVMTPHGMRARPFKRRCHECNGNGGAGIGVPTWVKHK